MACMSTPRIVHCIKLKKDLPGLESPPWPGALGQRIFDNVSAQAWKLWEERQKMILNEYRLMPWQKEAQELIAQAARGVLLRRERGDASGLRPGDEVAPLAPSTVTRPTRGTDGRSQLLRTPARAVDAVLHRDVGTVQLLRHAGVPDPVHDRTARGRRAGDGRLGCDVDLRHLHRSRVGRRDRRRPRSATAGWDSSAACCSAAPSSCSGTSCSSFRRCRSSTPASRSSSSAPGC